MIIKMTKVSMSLNLKNPLELYGNCIGIQHKNGAISIYGHLKQNSLMVKMGDSVVSGQKIAAIGVSGSSFFRICILKFAHPL